MDKPIANQIAQLEAVLQRLTQHHEHLLGLMRRQREALRTADEKAVSDLSRQENAVVQQITEQEKRRLELVASLTSALQPGAERSLKMREVAELLPEPARGRLLVLRAQLRERIESVKEQSSVTRRATQALMSHMQGLVQSLGQASTRGAGYDRPGQRQSALPAIGTINLTA